MAELPSSPLLDKAKALLQSADKRDWAAAAEILASPEARAQLTALGWLELLHITKNEGALAVVRALAEELADPKPLSIEQCVEIASGAAPAAELGLAWAQRKPIKGEAEVRALVALGRAEAPRVRERAVEWVLSVIERSPHSRIEHLRDLIASPHKDVRRPALALMRKALRFRDATPLWAALSESPHDDVRAFLLIHLTRRGAAFPPEAPRHVWASALLAVLGGGVEARGAARGIAEHIAARPLDVEPLLPLLDIALRRARDPERAAALDVVARAAAREPALREALAKALPDLAGERARGPAPDLASDSASDPAP
jgi:hypothetical protein